jgi:hypothetical protein
MMVAFVLPKPNHNKVVTTSDVNMMCVDEEDDFHLIGAQSYVRRSSSTRTDMSPSPRQCLAVFDPVVRGRVDGVMIRLAS